MISFRVNGLPQTAGSKRAFALKKGGVFTGRTIVTDANPKSREWKNLVSDAASQAMAGQSMSTLLGPLRLIVHFFLPRPQGHWGSGKNSTTLKASAPAWPATRPDATKLVRAIEDACTGIVWRDDSQIVIQVVTKQYSVPGCLITVVPASPEMFHEFQNTV